MDNSSGALGEQYTARYLETHGFEIVRRNFHSRFGEIDLIAQDFRYLAFVEVKTRAKKAPVGPLEAVTASKQRKIIRTAMLYLQANPTGLQPRFDVAAVTTEAGVPVAIRYLGNAFSCEGFF
ncbi:MAG: YraN family protein [Oscillospiraceae bacterium]|jgi:putative endonuclease|nr:YraN family protein [Oscillospiraceae bacterium]